MKIEKLEEFNMESLKEMTYMELKELKQSLEVNIHRIQLVTNWKDAESAVRIKA